MLLLALLSCHKDDPKPEAVCDPATENADASAIVPGAPLAAAAEDFLDLPVGSPLSGYTARCTCFGNAGKVDRRDSPYTYSFNSSAGVQTRIPVKAFWLSNGDQDLVVIKTDLIYSFDELVETIADQLTDQLGKDMHGKVVVSTNHSHSSYGDFSDQATFFLGSDRFNYEVFLRIVEKAVDTAMEAHNDLQPAKIGVGYAKDWDPDDRVYHDRRESNDTLQFFPDIPAGRYKDPNLTLMRIDSLDDQPIGVLFNFGVHGTTLGDDNAMISIDTPGHVERMFEEHFDSPVVVALLQGATGDASPSGGGDGYGGMERVGEYAAESIYNLWDETPTSADAIRLETVSRSVKETHDDIHITRGGTTDLRYTPYTEGLVADNVVYNPDGSLASPIDEFNVANGSAFCGEVPAYLPGFAPASIAPYSSCVSVDQMILLIKGFFDLTEEEAALPIRESKRANVTASRLGPIPIREADGTIVSDDFFIGFFPGEPTSMYTEQFRRRAASELGYQHSMAVGYSQDHEGYLLIPEDWLTGGYEIDINVWGPLQGEHIMEQLLLMAGEELSTDVVEKHDPCGLYQIPDYGEHVLPDAAPEVAPEAGTLLTEVPGYLYTPLYSVEELEAGAIPDIVVPAQVRRGQDVVQMAWIGGDPGVDFPLVRLEQQQGDGSWEPVLNPSGRAIENGPDILTTWTPAPLYTWDDTQTHYWYAAWQVVGPNDARMGLPLGMYRLHVEGQTFGGAATTWPWDAEPYSVDSPTFEVLPGNLTLEASGNDLWASIRGADRGFRMLGLNASSDGGVRLENDQLTLDLVYGDGHSDSLVLTGDGSSGRSTFAGVLAGVVSVTATDVFGNQGQLSLVTP